MTNSLQEKILAQVTVRLKDKSSDITIGTGLLYYHDTLRDKVYVVTAAHNLYVDGDSFQQERESIIVEIWNEKLEAYQAFERQINYQLVSPSRDRDFAVLLFEKQELAQLCENLPQISAVKERHQAKQFLVKGFPRATEGKELVTIFPTWLQTMHDVEKFQLQLKEDYSDYFMEGFSGSGVYIIDAKQVYWYGIFTRYRADEKGKVIYAQYAASLNELLEANFLTTISFTFYTTQGLTPDFFDQQVKKAITQLGPRYNAEFSFRLPLALRFHDLTRDQVFKKRLQTAFDKWITQNGHSYGTGPNHYIEDIEAAVKGIKQRTLDWLLHLDWQVDKPLDHSWLLEAVSQVNEMMEAKVKELYELQSKMIKEGKQEKEDRSRHLPLENEIIRLREIRGFNYTLFDDLSEVSLTLANHPCLLLQGDAGSGKSHLLGDVANQRNSHGQPALLLLGQLFRNSQSVWENIFSQLSLSLSRDEFLSALNEIGRQTGVRVLLMIDALNEGAGKEIWPTELAGFIDDIKRYPFIALCLSVRSTYFDLVVPKQLQENKTITKIKHEGFKGNEYAALRLFAQHYDLELPNFPLLTPEFSNPLFLQLTCQGIKAAGRRKFPQGFHGVSSLYSYYLDAIIDKLVRRRDEYYLRQQAIRSAVNKIAQACFEHADTHAVPLQDALTIFDVHFPAFPQLLADLLFENLLIQGISKSYDTGEETEVVYFAYERLGDYYMANLLLQPYSTRYEVIKAFEPEEKLGKIALSSRWDNEGILEVFAVLLPERFGIEIFEVYDWMFAEAYDEEMGNTAGWLTSLLLNNLKWRKTESIDDEKITAWLQRKASIDEHELFNLLIELTPLHSHPFNGDRVFSMLSRFKMPERDARWLPYLRFYSGYDDQESGYPIRRLIDWAWQKEVSVSVDLETARLVGQTMAWLLSSTDIVLRDQTTKALVNLLQEQIDALIAILQAFQTVDDVYILERLYAVAYGCALRTSDIKSLFKLAQYVYDTIFKDGSPPTHILLRDYAKNTVDYALYKGMNLGGEVEKIRPPYHSKMPSDIPGVEDMSLFELDREDPNFKRNYGHYHNQIKFSVMDWDFGRYTVDGAFAYFGTESFTFTGQPKAFIQSLSKEKKEIFKQLQSSYNESEMIRQTKGPDSSYTARVADCNERIRKIREELKGKLSEEEARQFFTYVYPFMENSDGQKTSPFGRFYTEPIKRWIVKRAFDLGYNAELHGNFDNLVSSYNNRSENKLERIGKKYQWIALYEAVAFVADNFYAKSDRWSVKSKKEIYAGPWLGHLRDVNPSLITLNKADETEDAHENYTPSESNWWINEYYQYWNRPSHLWVATVEDLPNPKTLISRTDTEGKDWVYLDGYFQWKEPKPIGKDRYHSDRKEIVYMLQSYIVKSRDKKLLLNWLKDKNFWGRWLPEKHSADLSLINRENYWSECSKQNEEETWKLVRGSRLKVMVSTTEATGELADDKSGAHFRYDMPCRLLFEGMELQYGPEDGSFLNKAGDLIAFNPTHRGILMEKQQLFQYLDKNNLDMIWCIIGEKNALTQETSSREPHFKVINGVYSFENGSLEGSLTLANRE